MEMEAPTEWSPASLNGMPTELLTLIMDELSLISKVILAFSCKRLRYRLGYQHLRKLYCSEKDRLLLLELLVRDVPNKILCITCKIVHDIENVARYNVASGSQFKSRCSPITVHDLPGQVLCSIRKWPHAIKIIDRFKGVSFVEFEDICPTLPACVKQDLRELCA